MPSYPLVSVLPPHPASSAECYVTLRQVGKQDQRYVFLNRGEPVGAWVPVQNDDSDPPNGQVFITSYTQKFSYNFATQGGVIGNITLTGGTVPAKAIVVGAVLDMLTNVTAGANGVLGLTLEAAGDMTLTNTLVTNLNTLGAYYMVGGTGGSVPLGTVDSVLGGSFPSIVTIKTTVARSLVLVIGTAALTAGKFDVYITYMVTA